MGVARFEDLRVWQAAKAFSDEIGGLFHRGVLHHDVDLRRQLNTASLSTMANIAEGFVRARHKEFAQFIRIASGSNAEARALLYAAEGRGYLSGPDLARLIEMTNKIGAMLRTLEKQLT